MRLGKIVCVFSLLIILPVGWPRVSGIIDLLYFYTHLKGSELIRFEGRLGAGSGSMSRSASTGLHFIHAKWKLGTHFTGFILCLRLRQFCLLCDLGPDCEFRVPTIVSISQRSVAIVLPWANNRLQSNSAQENDEKIIYFVYYMHQNMTALLDNEWCDIGARTEQCRAIAAKCRNDETDTIWESQQLWWGDKKTITSKPTHLLHLPPLLQFEQFLQFERAFLTERHTPFHGLLGEFAAAGLLQQHQAVAGPGHGDGRHTQRLLLAGRVQHQRLPFEHGQCGRQRQRAELQRPPLGRPHPQPLGGGVPLGAGQAQVGQRRRQRQQRHVQHVAVVAEADQVTVEHPDGLSGPDAELRPVQRAGAVQQLQQLAADGLCRLGGRARPEPVVAERRQLKVRHHPAPVRRGVGVWRADLGLDATQDGRVSGPAVGRAVCGGHPAAGQHRGPGGVQPAAVRTLLTLQVQLVQRFWLDGTHVGRHREEHAIRGRSAVGRKRNTCRWAGSGCLVWFHRSLRKVFFDFYRFQYPKFAFELQNLIEIECLRIENNVRTTFLLKNMFSTSQSSKINVNFVQTSGVFFYFWEEGDGWGHGPRLAESERNRCRNRTCGVEISHFSSPESEPEPIPHCHAMLVRFRIFHSSQLSINHLYQSSLSSTSLAIARR